MRDFQGREAEKAKACSWTLERGVAKCTRRRLLLQSAARQVCERQEQMGTTRKGSKPRQEQDYCWLEIGSTHEKHPILDHEIQESRRARMGARKNHTDAARLLSQGLGGFVTPILRSQQQKRMHARLEESLILAEPGGNKRRPLHLEEIWHCQGDHLLCFLSRLNLGWWQLDSPSPRQEKQRHARRG